MTGDDIATAGEQSENIETELSLSYSGPLPPAYEFEQYERASPGAGKEILTLAESTSRRSHEAQLDTNRTARHLAWAGVALITVVAFMVLVISLMLINAGAEWLGAIGSLAGAVFIGLGALAQWTNSRRN
ncbi:hypothetical protein [Candidatus Poriferisodalis sp.]|uniref:hypothetical protein n=1 Tax=Candidatus Poriferisodalis sp. TaxID=3101277 RepID=UPI003B026EC3